MPKYLQAYLPAFDSGILQFSVQGNDVCDISTVMEMESFNCVVSFFFHYKSKERHQGWRVKMKAED